MFFETIDTSNCEVREITGVCAYPKWGVYAQGRFLGSYFLVSDAVARVNDLRARGTIQVF